MGEGGTFRRVLGAYLSCFKNEAVSRLQNPFGECIQVTRFAIGSQQGDAITETVHARLVDALV